MRNSVETAAAWRAGDGAVVPLREATVAWALAAHAELSEIATGYGHFITVNALAVRVQEVSGVHTEAPTRTWMDAILRKIARRCDSAGEPPLIALCVRQNHTVGDTYKYVLELAGLPIPDDLELHAAYARWQCYRHYGAEMPADIATPPPLTPKATTRRRSASATVQTEVKPQPTRATVCAHCFIQLPANGTCEYCV
jgi:hypothetical protein